MRDEVQKKNYISDEDQGNWKWKVISLRRTENSEGLNREGRGESMEQNKSLSTGTNMYG